MAFQDCFVKVGDYKIPLKYMEAGTYNGYRSVQDLDSHTDGKGKLHRKHYHMFLALNDQLKMVYRSTE